jgi:hypothetical protein
MRQDDRDSANWQEIRVDLASLQQLTDALSAEVSYHLRPSVSQVFDQYEGGACFGVKSPSADLHAARRKYVDCLADTVDRLAAYVNESSRLVDAASEILSRYQSNDALASMSLDELRQAFAAANVDDQRGG